MGTTQRLDGPDTSGDKTADVLAVVTGRANERIVQTEQDLAAGLAAFREDTDGELRYTLNSIAVQQCDVAAGARSTARQGGCRRDGPLGPFIGAAWLQVTSSARWWNNGRVQQ